MNHNTNTALRLCAWMLVGLMFLAGCASQQKKKSMGTTTDKPAATGNTMPERPMMDEGRNHKTLYVPTGERATSAVALEKHGPVEVNLGQPFEYVITAENLTSGHLNGVTVSDHLPEGLELVSSDPATTGMMGEVASWTLGHLKPGETRTIRVTAVANKAGSIRHCAEVVYNQRACIFTDVVEPALMLTKRMTPEVLTCDNIDVVITVTNNGTGTARNVVVKDDMPNGMMAADGQSGMMMNVGDLAAGESREIRKTVRVSAPGEYENTAVATADGGLQAQASSRTVARRPMLEISKTGPELVYRDKMITYELMLRNTGDGDARDCQLVDMLPAGVTYQSSTPAGSFDGANVVWNLGTLAAGDERTIRVTVRADEIRQLTNRAKAMAYCADEVNAMWETDVKGIPAILLEVVDIEDPIPVGSNVTYVIRVTNQGSADGTGIEIICDLESQMQYVNSSGATNGTGSTDQVVFEPLGRLAPGAVAEWRVTLKATDEGDVRFKVTMRSDNRERPVQETEATNFYK